MTVVWLIVIGGLIAYYRKGSGQCIKMNVRQNMHVKELGISNQVWQQFCHLAAARRVSQTKQIGEAIELYIEESRI